MTKDEAKAVLLKVVEKEGKEEIIKKIEAHVDLTFRMS